MRVNKFIISGFILVMVLWVNIFLRAYPINFPQFLVQAEIKAENLVSQEAALEAEKNFPGRQIVPDTS